MVVVDSSTETWVSTTSFQHAFTAASKSAHTQDSVIAHDHSQRTPRLRATVMVCVHSIVACNVPSSRGTVTRLSSGDRHAQNNGFVHHCSSHERYRAAVRRRTSAHQNRSAVRRIGK